MVEIGVNAGRAYATGLVSRAARWAVDVEKGSLWESAVGRIIAGGKIPLLLLVNDQYPFSYTINVPRKDQY